jgi:8-oxo-dGTP pyrophosphatase MutT (NUDIX family)
MSREPIRYSLYPITRRFMHGYWRLSRGMTLGVRALVLDGNGRVFLVKHSYVRGWHLPGGGVEVNETIMTALERELREEGNIAIAEPPVLHALYFNKRVSRRDHVALFVVRAFTQTSPPEPNREIIDHGFFPTDALPEDTARATRERIAEVLTGRPPSELW